MAEQNTKVILRSLRGLPLDCGCIVDWNENAASLTYCPMHKAAPELLGALEALLLATKTGIYSNRAVIASREALASARRWGHSRDSTTIPKAKSG